jgi:hypothetical protein
MAVIARRSVANASSLSREGVTSSGMATAVSRSPRTLSPFLIRNQVSLLDQATTHIKYLEMTQQAENETARLHQYVLLPCVHHNNETDVYVKGQ